MTTTTAGVAVIEMPGRVRCMHCLGLDDYRPCEKCDGTGWHRRAPGPACATCNGTRLATVTRDGWHELGWPSFERLPLFRCDLGHRTAIRYLPVPE